MEKLVRRPEARCTVCGVPHYHLSAAGIEALATLGLPTGDIVAIQALDGRLAEAHQTQALELPADLPEELAEAVYEWAKDRGALVDLMRQEDALERSRRLNRERQARFKKAKKVTR